MDLRTSYLGLKLRNPVIAASSGLTGTMDSLMRLEESGAAAVVLKSIFEEEILMEVKRQLRDAQKDPQLYSALSETLDYIDLHIRENNLTLYLNLISDASLRLSIPVIASINCVSDQDWVYFARRMEEAGAHALELNLFLNPASTGNEDFEKTYFRIISQVLEVVKIPVSVKISKYLTRTRLTVQALGETGISGIVMFNRFYTPDIDVNSMSLTRGNLLTSPHEQYETLRWVAILSRDLSCDLAATTGIHTGEDVVKMILAGATTVQVASTLYKNGTDQLGRILKWIQKWMTEKEFSTLDQFRGKVAASYGKDPASFERMQFMKHFSEIG